MKTSTTFYFFVICSCFIFNTNLANAQWTAQTSGTTVSLRSVYFPDANTGYTVGSSGLIRKTINGGSSWTSLFSGTTQTLCSVFFMDVNTGWVAGYNGTILKTTNGGLNWTTQPSGTTDPLFSIFFVDANCGYAVGGWSGMVLKTINGGINWTLQTDASSDMITSAYFTDANTGYVADISGSIFKTGNGGSTWITQTSGTSNSLNSICFADPNTGYSVGENGTILKTVNGGTSWAPQTSGTINGLNSVCFINSNVGYVVGVSGTILKTTDGGINWIAQVSGTTNGLSAVHFTPANMGYAVGNSGIILSTMFATPNWNSQASGTTQYLLSVFFTDVNTGYIAGNNGILKTIDGGTNWAPQTSGTANALNSVVFPEASTGYSAGNNGTIIKTTDGGTNWVLQTSGTTQPLWSVFFINASTGYAIGNGGTIIKTTNGGATWTTQTGGTTNVLYSVFFIGTDTGYITGTGGLILRTTNGGASWTLQASGTTNNLNAVFFPNDSIGYIAGANGTILKTTNHGLTWTAQTSGTSDAIYSVHFTDANKGCVVGGNGIILKTGDGGITWTPQFSGTMVPLRSVYFPDVNTGFAVGYNGTIIKTTSGGWCTGIPGKPAGPNSICQPTGNYQYVTTGADYATSYIWSLKPASAGTISGSGTTSAVVWNGTCNTNVAIIVQGDKAGCTGETSSLTVAINHVLPGTFSLTSPVNGSWVSGTPLFQWGTSTGSTKYSLYVDGVLKKENITGTSYQLLPDEAMSNGMHTWYVTGNNICTTQSNETWSFRADAASPSVFNLTAPANNSWTTNTQPTFQWSASSDVSSGLAKYQLWIDGVLNKDNISNSSTTTTPVSPLANGSHTWWIKAIDNVGNSRSSDQTWTLKIDDIPPGVYNSSALNLDGINDYVSIGSASILNMTYNFTIEAWVNFQSGGNNSPRIISKQTDDWGMPGDYSIYTDGTGTSRKIHFWIKNIGEIITSNFLYAGTYNHVAATISGTQTASQMLIYINGEVQAQGNFTGTLAPTTTPVVFGRKGSGSNNLDLFCGKLDEIRFWNYCRSQSQINEYKEVPLSGNEPGLAGYWNFDEQTGSTAYDLTGQNNGAVYGGATYSTTNLPMLKLCHQYLPVSDGFLPEGPLLFKWGSAPDKGIGFEKFQLFVDGILKANDLPDTTYVFSSPLSYGQHNWFVKGFDSLDNNQPCATRSFYIDNAPPNVFDLVLPPDSGIVNLPTPDLTWQNTLDSTGGSGLRKYQLWINQVKNRDSIPAAQTTISPSAVLQQGEYSWFVKAFDNVGNIRQSIHTRIFFVDWEPPTAFTLVSPVNDDTVKIRRPLFKWHSSSDIGSGLLRYELNISGKPIVIVAATDTSVVLPYNLTNGAYTWFVKAFDRAGSFTSSNVHAFIADIPIAISGVFSYNNSQNTAMDSVRVYLKRNNVVKDSIKTDLTGNYVFYIKTNGTYSLISQTTKPWGGVNGTDALKIQRHFTGLEYITEPVRLQAADVNNSGSINGTDALKVKRRFTGMDTGFDRGDWTFAKAVTGGDTIIINGNDVNQNFYGLCVGDVNGSNVPVPGKSGQENVLLVLDGSIRVTAGQIIELPVRVNAPGQFGAVSLVFNYPSAWMTIEDVTMNRSGLIYHISGNQVRIAWSDPEPLDLGSGDVLLTLHIKATDDFNTLQPASFLLTNESEIADGWGNIFPSVVLSIPDLVTKTEEGSEKENISVYPNPASDLVNVQFDLSSAGNIDLRIIDPLGQVVYLEQSWVERGSVSRKIDISALPTGVYYLKLECKTGGVSSDYIYKIVKLKN